MIPLTPALIEALDARFGNVWLSVDGHQVNVTCPYCHKRGKTPDQSGHLGLNFSLGVLHCVRCDYGHRNLWQWLDRHHVDSGLIAGLRMNVLWKPDEKPVAALYDPGGLSYLPDMRRLEGEDWALASVFGASLAQKGITFEEAHRHAVCGCESGPEQGYVIFPFFERSAEPAYWQGRDATGQAFLRKLNPNKQQAVWGKAAWLYNFERTFRGCVLYIVEGTLDAISLQSWLLRHKGTGHIAVSVQGTAVSFPGENIHPLNTQYGKIRALHPLKVYVVFDPDAYHKSVGLAATLQCCGINAEALRLFGGDPNEVARDGGSSSQDPLALMHNAHENLRRALANASF